MSQLLPRLRRRVRFFSLGMGRLYPGHERRGRRTRFAATLNVLGASVLLMAEVVLPGGVLAMPLWLWLLTLLLSVALAVTALIIVSPSFANGGTCRSKTRLAVTCQVADVTSLPSWTVPQPGRAPSILHRS